jgi:hypothetical protein
MPSIAGPRKAVATTPKKAAASQRPTGTRTKATTAGVPTPRAVDEEAAALVPPIAAPGLTEEEQIESAKYEPRRPRRVFEEERFIFPETYGVNRIRLLVKDPEWLFVYWDVDPRSLDGFRAELGERAVAVSKLTLRIADPTSGGMSVVLLPPGVRSWYVRADSRRRAYQAELGFTLPSGEFRRLAESNSVVTPRVGPSPERARKTLLYSQAQMIPRTAGIAVGDDEVRSASRNAPPWSPDRKAPATVAEQAADGEKSPGGASDSFGPGGASDVYRR